MVFNQLSQQKQTYLNSAERSYYQLFITLAEKPAG
jgi:hypothetical protein